MWGDRCVSQSLSSGICLASHIAKLQLPIGCERTVLTVWALTVLQPVRGALVLVLYSSPHTVLHYVFPLPLLCDSFKLQCLSNAFQISCSLMPIQVLFSRCRIMPERGIIRGKSMCQQTSIKNHCLATSVLIYFSCWQVKNSVSQLLINTD